MKGGEKNDLFWPAGAGRLVTNLMRGTDKSGFSDSLNLTLPNKTKLERRERRGDVVHFKEENRSKFRSAQRLGRGDARREMSRGGIFRICANKFTCEL